ncbi:FAD-dependent monooxygenase [Terriglobus roseus]|uniref:2-polyprenyl-6-methoxyphenol hydroxylase n=1 Tax=Terriglobus roseus TaxID=392734 RepID=A0A1H4J0Z3_9BACT|nr:FAD-dependent monooxygenase [Terriglobus roseus]SEB39626.1 2-polyprenyl-6-methoxyphenol hydroxylase [Terriglobus roseus]
MKPGKAILAGGSVGGLFAGVLLQRAGWDVVLYERSVSGLAGKGAGLVPQSEVAAILEEVGRRDVLSSGVIAHERIFLDRSGAISETIPSPQSQMSWDLLFSAFRSLVADAEYHSGKVIVHVASSASEATVRFEDGAQRTADVVIGADGIGSVVRQMVAPGTELRYAGYAAFRGLSPETRLSKAAADLLSERFAFLNAFRSQYLGYLVAGPDGSIAPGRRRYNWVWYRALDSEQLQAALQTEAGDDRLYSAPPGGLSNATVRELADAAQSLLPPVLAELVRSEPRPFLQAIFDYGAPQMNRGRVALLGDAAFVVRPHTAMGVSKAAGDAMALRDALEQSETVEEALNLYNLQRHPVGTAIAAYGQRLGRSFAASE